MGSMFYIRSLREDDDLHAMTALLHAAYAPLAERGMRYLASHQSVGVTRTRAFGTGRHCSIAECDDVIVGTVTLSTCPEVSECSYYADPSVARFGQFGVLPELQCKGIGRALMETIENKARLLGMSHIACDTSEHAHHLIEYYKRRGYEPVDRVDWPVTNYVSVVLSKDLDGSSPGHNDAAKAECPTKVDDLPCVCAVVECQAQSKIGKRQ